MEFVYLQQQRDTTTQVQLPKFNIDGGDWLDKNQDYIKDLKMRQVMSVCQTPKVSATLFMQQAVVMGLFVLVIATSLTCCRCKLIPGIRREIMGGWTVFKVDFSSSFH